jgi:hypothetical protein
VAAVGSVFDQLSMDSGAIQRSFESELKTVFTQWLSAECMVNAKRIA